MSLLDEAYEKFIIYNKVRVDDGYGGNVQKYVDGPEIDGIMSFDSSLQARVAEAQNVHSVYTFTTKKNISLEYHDVLRRLRDGKVFRITSDGDDDYTPDSAGLNMRQVTAEEWQIPADERGDA